VSSDETWTPSIDDEDSQGNDDDVVESMSWQESPMKQSIFEINFDKVDQDLEHGYFQETKQIRKRILFEYNTICSDNKKPSSRLNAVEIFNAIYTVDVLLPVLAFQNKAIISRNKHPIDFHEYECFVQVFFGLYFYHFILADVEKHPETYPLLISAIQKLPSQYKSLQSKICCANDLLCV
jgi:hypothetical protein